LRKKATHAEKRLWRIVRDRRFSGYKFRRQHPIGPYYLDFYCPEAKVAVEVDGGQHGYPDQKRGDEARDAFLAGLGIVVKRFWNYQIRRESRMVRDNLWMLLQSRAPHPGNLPRK
jgi:very-short-patch-repair endonuclease